MCYISRTTGTAFLRAYQQSMEFVLNLTTEDMAYATDWCGVRSGRDYRKFEEMKLTRERPAWWQPPSWSESPLNIECRVKEVVSFRVA